MQKLPRPLAIRQNVKVDVEIDEDGEIVPKRIFWPGREGGWREVEKGFKSGPGVARKAGGAGLRFEVRIENYIFELFLVEGIFFFERTQQGIIPLRQA